LDRTRTCRAFIGAAKIESVLHAELSYNADVALGQKAQMIGAEDMPPADAAAVGGRVAAKVAEIARTLQIEVANGGVLHHWILSQTVRQRNDVDCGIAALSVPRL